jgi:membrane associated rhomboid family serine protease
MFALAETLEYCVIIIFSSHHEFETSTQLLNPGLDRNPLTQQSLHRRVRSIQKGRHMNLKPFPRLTCALVVSNLVVWMLFSSKSQEGANALVDTFAFSPVSLSQNVASSNHTGILTDLARALSSIFVHEHDPWHVGLNMLLLALCGISIERRLGTMRYAILYAAAGILTCGVYFTICPDGRPSFGASSAVCGVLGAYLVLLVKQHPFVSIVAAILLALNVMGALNPAAVAQTGFTFWAHLSGYAIGALTAALMTLEVNPRKKQVTA